MRESDGRPLLIEQITAEIDAIKDEFLEEIKPDAYKEKWNDMHLMQTKVKTLLDVRDLLDKMILDEQPMVEIDSPI